MKKASIIAIVMALASSPAFAATFASQDTNGDGEISRDEFYGSVADAGIYADLDTNNDGLLDENEFGALGYDWDYDAWDTNEYGFVDSGEFYDGLYASYDANEDGHWDGDDWDDAGEAGLFDW